MHFNFYKLPKQEKKYLFIEIHQWLAVGLNIIKLRNKIK